MYVSYDPVVGFRRAATPVNPKGAAVRQEIPLAVDIHEDEASVELLADLPGVSPEDVDIHLEKGVLTIVGERRPPASETQRTTHQERQFGLFRRQFKLPGSTDESKIEASFSQGVLRILLPKSAAARARQIPVSVH